jgi:hypothetical protein
MSALKKRLVRYCSSCSGEESAEFLIESLRTQHFRVLLTVFIASLVLFFLGVRPGTFSSTSKHLSPLGSIHRAVSYPSKPEKRNAAQSIMPPRQLPEEFLRAGINRLRP